MERQLDLAEEVGVIEAIAAAKYCVALAIEASLRAGHGTDARVGLYVAQIALEDASELRQVRPDVVSAADRRAGDAVPF